MARHRPKDRTEKRAAERLKRLRLEIAHQQALEALNIMRIKRWSITRAAQYAHTSAESVRKHVGTALRRKPDGSWGPTPSDRLKRSLKFLTRDGTDTLEVRS